MPETRATTSEGAPIAGSRLHRRVHSRACSYDTARRRKRSLTPRSASDENKPITPVRWLNTTKRWRSMAPSPCASQHHHGAACDVHDHAGDPGALIRRQEERGTCDVL